MTEQEWLECMKIEPLLEYLDGKVSERKWRLFAVACCRRVWPLWSDEERNTIEFVERHADGNHAVWNQLGDEGAVWDFLCSTDAVKCRNAGICEASCKFADSRPNVRGIHGTPTGEWFLASWEEIGRQCNLLRDMLGNPFRSVAFDPAWRTPNVTAVAQAIYEGHRFADLPVLADALEESGCSTEDILSHCRSGGEHFRGCWVVDLVLGKE